MTASQDRKRLSLWDALMDLGWFSFVLMGLGGLSLIDIIERVITIDLNLITPLEVVMKGYRRVASLLGAIVEPLVDFLLDWINQLLGLRLHVHEYWRSLYILVMVPWLAAGRNTWREGDKVRALQMLVQIGAVMLCLSLYAALGGIELFSFGLAFPQSTVSAFAIAILLVGLYGVIDGLWNDNGADVKRGLATVGGFLAAALMLLANAVVKGAQ